MPSASPPAPAPPPPNCCRSGNRGRSPSCLKPGENTQFWSAVLGTRFHLASVSATSAGFFFLFVSCGVGVCGPAADGGCFWTGVWVNVRWSALTAPPPHTHRLPHSHKHKCRCCLMECDMDNSLHRSHQNTQLQHWRVPDTHTDTGWHKCYAHTHAHLTTQRCVSSQALFPQMESAGLTHTDTHLNTNTQALLQEEDWWAVQCYWDQTQMCTHTVFFCQHDYSWEQNRTKNCTGRVWMLIGERHAPHRGVLPPFSPTQTNRDGYKDIVNE